MSEPTPTPPASADYTDLQRVFACGLLVACPMTQNNPPECLLVGLREKPMKERFAWLSSLTPAEVDELIAHVEVCLIEKERREKDGLPLGCVGRLRRGRV